MYYIFEAIEEDGEQQLAEVEDEELLDRLSQIFESRFEELYEYDEEEDSETSNFFLIALLKSKNCVIIILRQGPLNKKKILRDSWTVLI